MKIKKPLSAFSLIEISIVIVIIGILIAGIANGNVITKKSRLKTARNLTISSPVNATADLVLWLETSLETSFANSERIDGSTVSAWYDNNSAEATKNDATQTTTDNKPLFRENVFNNSIPGIRFDGSNDYLDFDGSSIVGTPYTIFIVEQRRSSATNNYFIGGTSSTDDGNLTLGYSNNTTAVHGQYSDDITYSVTSYSSPTPKLHTYTLNDVASLSNSGKRYWINGSGASASKASNVSQTATLVSFLGAAIGKRLTNYFNGDLAEIIIFNRNLKEQERLAIDDYLGKKYNINVTLN
ncbi:MAG: prepilin-type N-terminal cleavage/methylation domain-containing protein [Rickettsiales bacterium]|nr:prepilin-type N-terminal cleavage/methylation domain-containing protein [Rickettsiales bacterium]